MTTNAGAQTDLNFDLGLHRQGADYQSPKGFITGQFLRIQATEDGVEYPTHETIGGLPIFARTYVIVGDKTSNFTIDTLPTGLRPTEAYRMIGGATQHTISDYDHFATTGDRARLSYDEATGALAFVISGRTIFSGTRVTIRYTK